MKKILILKPAYNAHGGISNYFKVLENKFTLPVKYFIRGARKQPHTHSRIFLILLYLYDLCRFQLLLIKGQYGIIHVNTSLGVTGMYRDAAFIWLARIFNCKVIVFFRGLDIAIQTRFDTDFSFLIKKFYLKADMILTLSESFALRLKNQGYRGKIIIETTTVDDDLLKKITYASLIQKRNTSLNTIKLLFLSRIEKKKGIYEAIEAYRLVKSKFYEVELFIAGDGTELEKVRADVSKKNIQGVIFHGYVEGEQKSKIFTNSSIFLLPSYTEGLPNSILEAMAFGLPVIATKVGGIPDVIKDFENGFLIEKSDPELISQKIMVLLDKKPLYEKISRNNFDIAQKKFLASKVVKRLEDYYKELINDND